LLLTVLQTFIESKRLKKDYETLRTMLAENLVEKYVFKYLPDKVINDEIKYIIQYSSVVFLAWTIELIFMMNFIVKLV